MNNSKSPQPTFVIDGADRLQVAQAFYNAVTGKTEKLTRAYNTAFIIKPDDLKQLHLKCSQMCSQWAVVAKNSNVVIDHLDDNKEQFSSFERSEIYNSSNTSPVEVIIYEYNILANLPNQQRPQTYKLIVRMQSGLSLYEKMQRDLSSSRLYKFFRNATIIVEIEYVDYVVARSIIATIDSWINEIEVVTPVYNWITKLENFAHWIPRFTHLFIFTITSFSFFILTPSYIAAPGDSVQLGKWLIFVFGFVYISSMIGRYLGFGAASAIEELTATSVIKFNKGDEKLIQKFRNKNLLQFAKMFFSLLGFIIQVLSSDFLIRIVSKVFFTK
jgi:hypothetical protein